MPRDTEATARLVRRPPRFGLIPDCQLLCLGLTAATVLRHPKYTPGMTRCPETGMRRVGLAQRTRMVSPRSVHPQLCGQARSRVVAPDVHLWWPTVGRRWTASGHARRRPGRRRARCWVPATVPAATSGPKRTVPGARPIPGKSTVSYYSASLLLAARERQRHWSNVTTQDVLGALHRPRTAGTAQARSTPEGAPESHAPTSGAPVSASCLWCPWSRPALAAAPRLENRWGPRPLIA